MLLDLRRAIFLNFYFPERSGYSSEAIVPAEYRLTENNRWESRPTIYVTVRGI